LITIRERFNQVHEKKLERLIIGNVSGGLKERHFFYEKNGNVSRLLKHLNRRWQNLIPNQQIVQRNELTSRILAAGHRTADLLEYFHNVRGLAFFGI